MYGKGLGVAKWQLLALFRCRDYIPFTLLLSQGYSRLFVEETALF